MSKGYFTDKLKKPTDNDLQSVIGKGTKNWNLILEYLENLKLKGEWKFYGKNYGWALRFNKSGKSVIALYPNQDSFTVQIILNFSQVEKVLAEVSDTRIKQQIIDTESIHEGKWIFLNIDKDFSLKDIFNMIEIRIKVK